MAAETPHMKWPFSLERNGTSLEFVEQDTPQEIAQCVGFLLSTEPGELMGSPKMGLDDPTFRIGGVPLADLLSTINRWEPRAKLVFSEDELVNKAQTIGILVE